MNTYGFGLSLILFAAAWLMRDKLPFVGHLPGDIHMELENCKLTIPIVTCFVVSVLAAILSHVIGRK